MTKLKRHTSYWIEVEGLWFEFPGGKESVKIVKTAKRAFSIAASLKRQYPDKEVKLTKFYFKHGKRYGTDYIF